MAGHFRRSCATIVGAALLSAACGSTDESQSSDVSPASDGSSTNNLERLVVGYPGPTSAFVHTLVADEAGLFEKHGFDLDLITVQAQSIATALDTGDLDMTPAAGSNVRAALNGIPVKVVAVSLGSFDYVILADRTDVADVGALVGARIASTPPATTPAVALLSALDGLGVESADVELVVVNDPGARERLLSAGEVDAAIVNADAALRLQAADPNLHVLHAPDQFLPNPFTGVTVSASMLADDPERVERMIRVYLDAGNLIVNDPARTLAILQSVYALDGAQAQDLYDLLVPIIVSDGLMTEAMYDGEATLDALALSRDVTRDDLDGIFDLSLTETLQP